MGFLKFNSAAGNFPKGSLRAGSMNWISSKNAEAYAFMITSEKFHVQKIARDVSGFCFSF